MKTLAVLFIIFGLLGVAAGVAGGADQQSLALAIAGEVLAGGGLIALAIMEPSSTGIPPGRGAIDSASLKRAATEVN